ncbi:FAD-dependent monooxygenase [Lentzea sp. BCCO 10_0856]|uniref:FAD-dependent monooxygenase n=1 Tax=Lentzea miocenica TaxID=3095431 RepID=A0ABU4TB57_9PSEU|nr:FAD-dependent monooxygenase [Lentzea sp. BCCO 10_0856]MDX8035172.1 FAD-dependent monooxygenase [Lentzea sp. BCCO 10_0856]
MKAVVIGGGIAGLLAARVLGESHDVVVLERDKLSDEPEYRSGVPQGRHVHGLLVRGGELMEGLFPGLRAELVAAGAPLADAGDMRILNSSGWLATTHTGLPLLSLSRPLLETAMRRRVTAKIVDDVHVTGLSFRGGDVDGVLTRDGRIEADLVVDASGRSSKLAAWLAEAGITAPEPEVVDSRTGYATRIYTAPKDFPVVYAQSLSAPDITRGCAVMRIEGDRLMVTAQGAADDHAPRDLDGYQEFLDSLRVPISELLAEAEPLTPVYLFARTASRRNAFEATANWPGGLVAVGDAVCAFNPVYGQGMTVAAMEALLFRQHDDFSAEGCRAFQRKVAKAAQGTWAMSSNADRSWAETKRGGVFGWYLKKWQAGIVHDPDLFRRFVRVVHMVASPASLFNPVVFRRLAKYSRQDRRPARRPGGSSLR